MVLACFEVLRHATLVLVLEFTEMLLFRSGVCSLVVVATLESNLVG